MLIVFFIHFLYVSYVGYVYVNTFCTIGMQAKHGDEVATMISQTMDFPKAGNTQSLANSLHEFLEYKKCLQ
jgi:hypothetical protein